MKSLYSNWAQKQMKGLQLHLPDAKNMLKPILLYISHPQLLNT